MSPAQYRALEALVEASTGDPGGLKVDHDQAGLPGYVHPRTADALERRGLAILLTGDYGHPDLLIVTDEGAELLETNPTPYAGVARRGLEEYDA